MVVNRTSLFINCSTGLDQRQNRNMGYVCVFALSVKCEASHNNIVKVDFFYTVRAGTEQKETVIMHLF